VGGKKGEGGREGKENMPLGKGDLALWSSSYAKRKPGERDLVAWWRGWMGKARGVRGMSGGGRGEGGREE
jgi:hypothetical protein